MTLGHDCSCGYQNRTFINSMTKCTCPPNCFHYLLPHMSPHLCSLLNVEQSILKKTKDVVQSLWNACILQHLFSDPHLTTCQSNISVQFQKALEGHPQNLQVACNLQPTHTYWYQAISVRVPPASVTSSGSHRPYWSYHCPLVVW